MSPGITISIHFWRGFGPDTQRDLFYWQRLRLGFLTIAIERRDPLAAYRKLRAASSAVVESARRQDEDRR